MSDLFDEGPEIEVLENDQKVGVEAPEGRHVFLKADDGLEYALEESDATQFPDEDVFQRVREETDYAEMPDVLPLEFTVHAHDDPNTRSLLRSADLPTEDEELREFLYYYPGEITITYRLEEDARRGYDVTALQIEYEGRTFKPVDDEE